jgi:uncharacterized protein
MVIDACSFHDWTSVKEVAEYLPEGWRQLALRPGDKGGPLSFRSPRLYTNPTGSKDREVAPTAEEDAAANLIANLLDSGRTDRVVLGFDDGLLNTAYPHDYAAQVAVRATNDWNLERWLSRDDRLFGMVLISTSIPEAAAAEIRRVGKDDRIVAVAMGASVLDKTFGNPIYHPVYEAAVEMGLPLVIQTGCENFANHLLPPTAGGLPQTYGEYYALNNQAIETHLSRMVFHGIFERFPSLKVLAIGGGVSWVPSQIWKMDFGFKTTWAETPWLRRPPSEYFREHVRVSTYQIEHPEPPSRLVKALSTVPWIDEVLLYASGYPNWDWGRADAVGSLLPGDWRGNVLERNAIDFFRWPGKPQMSPRPGISPQAMSDVPV